MLVVSLLLYLLALGMSEWAPAFTIRGEIRLFRPAGLEPAFVPLALLPLSITLKIVCKRWLLVPELMLIGVAALIIVKGGSFLHELGPIPILVALAVTWSILVAVLYSYGFHRDLVRE